MLTDKNKLHSGNLGQSIVEVIVAVSIFVIIAGGSVITILGSFLASRLAEEETAASFYAVEGLEAAKSIRNRTWSNIGTADGNHGLDKTSGTWTFSGTSDSVGKYTRVVNIVSLERDGSGNIAASGGTPDENSKKVTSTVTWSFVPAKLSSVEMVTYLTNWQEVSYMGSGAPTPTLTPTPSVTPTPTSTPPITTCNAYCISISYTQGTCRRNVSQCTSNGEVNQPGGNQYCTSGPNTTCCCK